MTDDSDVRPEIVHALFEATQDPELSDEVTRDMLLDARPAERQAVSDLHGRLADLSLARAGSLYRALEVLKGWWYSPTASLLTILKVCPPDVADQVLTILYAGGWTEQDGLPPRPEAPGASP